jgi:hypothetical protein
MTDNTALLQSIQAINENIKKANNSCDHDCMIARQRSELKNAYIAAERNVRNAPEKYAQAQHNYLLDKYGPKEYTELLIKRYENNANQDITKLQEEHNQIMKEVRSGLVTIGNQDVQIVNSEIYSDLLDSNKSNVEATTNANAQNASVNNRKVYYMEKKIESLSWWYYMVRSLYWICVIVWFLVYVLYYRQFNNRSVILFVLFFAYPFFMLWLFVQAYSLYKYILSFIPRDIYLNF